MAASTRPSTLASAALAELRDFAHGVFPAVLDEAGTRAGAVVPGRPGAGSPVDAATPGSADGAADRGAERATYLVAKAAVDAGADRSVALDVESAGRPDRARGHGRRRGGRGAPGRTGWVRWAASFASRGGQTGGGDPVRVVVAEDNLLTREGIVQVLRAAGVDVGRRGRRSRGGCSAVVARERPDAAVVDIRMPPTHTDEGLGRRGADPAGPPGDRRCWCSRSTSSRRTPCGSSSEHAERRRLPAQGPGLRRRRAGRRAAAARASGESVVDPTIVAQLLGRRRKADPVERLTPREREVLALVAEGYSNKAIAAHLVVTERTVEAHITQTFTKLGLTDDPASHRRVLAVLAFLRAQRIDSGSTMQRRCRTRCGIRGTELSGA